MPTEPPLYVVEDMRSFWDEDCERETVLEALGNAFTYRDLLPWRGQGAIVWEYRGGDRTLYGHVDLLLGITSEEAYADTEAMANAHLIAAAPDLYAALEALVLAEEAAGSDGREADRRRAAIAALRKAKGSEA